MTVLQWFFNAKWWFFCWKWWFIPQCQWQSSWKCSARSNFVWTFLENAEMMENADLFDSKKGGWFVRSTTGPSCFLTCTSSASRTRWRGRCRRGNFWSGTRTGWERTCSLWIVWSTGSSRRVLHRMHLKKWWFFSRMWWFFPRKWRFLPWKWRFLPWKWRFLTWKWRFLPLKMAVSPLKMIMFVTADLDGTIARAWRHDRKPRIKEW